MSGRIAQNVYRGATMGKSAKIGSFVVTAALFVVGITLPSTNWINENRAAWITIMAVIALAIGALLYWAGTRLERKKTNTSEPTPLSDSDKLKVSSLMETVYALNDRMDRFMDESLYFDGDRVRHYQSLIDHPEFRGLWDKYSTQSAQVIVISPELGELVRDLLKLTQSHHRYFLKEWYMNQISHLSKETDKHLMAIEIFRKRIQKVLEQLLNRS